MSLTFKHILVPLDGSLYGERAIPYAVDLAERFAARVVLFRSAALPPDHWAGLPTLGLGVGTTEPVLEVLDYEKQLCENYLNDILSSTSAGRNIEIQTGSAVGHPVETILEHSNSLEAPLIVMSSHGRDGLGRWLMGSVAEKVARHAECPVMIIRGADEPKGG